MLEVFELRQQLKERYESLVASLLTFDAGSGFYKSSQSPDASYDFAGFKFHISATILNVAETLEKIGPYLKERRILFKAPKSLESVIRLNTGFGSEYCQIGKVITVYPNTSDPKFLKELAIKLHHLTSFDLKSPVIPFDKRFMPESRVYYRYGSYYRMKSQSIEQILTERYSDEPVPKDLDDPISGIDLVAPKDQLLTDYPVFEVLNQRGKGGVYQAIYLNDETVTPCVIKEGRKYGEVDWCGNDGFFYRKSEYQNIVELQSNGVSVPEVIDFLESEKSCYLILKDQGLSLFKYTEIHNSSIKKRIDLLLKVLEQLVLIRDAGKLWLDCKSDNILVDTDMVVYLIDFESMSTLDKPVLFAFTSYQSYAGKDLADMDKISFLIVCFEILTRKKMTENSFSSCNLDDVSSAKFGALYVLWECLNKEDSITCSLENIRDMLLIIR